MRYNAWTKLLDSEEMLAWWNIVRPRTRNERLEIRLSVRVSDNRVFSYAREIAQILDIPIKSSSQLFIRTLAELKFILQYKKGALLSMCKPCYGVNPRRVNAEGEWGGSYDNLAAVRVLYLDLEPVNHSSEMSSEMRREFDFFVQNVLNLASKKYDLHKYIEIDSGNGTHLLFPITEKKLKGKEHVKKVKEKWQEMHSFLSNTNNSWFKIDDGAKDFSRILSIPFTFNTKYIPARLVTIKRTCKGVNEFKLRAKTTHVKTNQLKLSDNWSLLDSDRVTVDTIRSHPLTRLLLTTNCEGTLSRNHYVEFGMACLLRDNQIDWRDPSIIELKREIDSVQKKSMNFSSEHLPEDAHFSRAMINKFTKTNLGKEIF